MHAGKRWPDCSVLDFAESEQVDSLALCLWKAVPQASTTATPLASQMTGYRNARGLGNKAKDGAVFARPTLQRTLRQRLRGRAKHEAPGI